MKRARVRISGSVQGVYFRSETKAWADFLGVAGWVRNNADGTVDAVFEGEAERVERMIAWCGRGPAGARVDDLAVEWMELEGENGFYVVV